MEFTHFDDQGNALMVDVGDKKRDKEGGSRQGKYFHESPVPGEGGRGDYGKGRRPGGSQSGWDHGSQKDFGADPAVPSIKPDKADRGFYD